MRSLVVVFPEIDNADVEHAQEQKRSNHKCDGPHPGPHFAHLHVSNFAREPIGVQESGPPISHLPLAGVK